MKLQFIFTLTLLSLITQAKVDFEKDVKPIFEDRCISCHRKAYKETRRGREKIKKPRGGIQLDDRDKALAFEDDGKKLINLKIPKKSLIYKYTTLPEDHEDVMPPKGDKLTGKQIATILKWIAEGAKWPDKFKNIEYIKPKK